MNLKAHLKTIAFFTVIACCTYLAIIFPLVAAGFAVAGLMVCVYVFTYMMFDSKE